MFNNCPLCGSVLKLSHSGTIIACYNFDSSKFLPSHYAIVINENMQIKEEIFNLVTANMRYRFTRDFSGFYKQEWQIPYINPIDNKIKIGDADFSFQKIKKFFALI